MDQGHNNGVAARNVVALQLATLQRCCCNDGVVTTAMVLVFNDGIVARNTVVATLVL